MENEQAKFEGWAIVEMMGHQREIGYVTTEAYGVAVLFRVDVPNLEAREWVLQRPEWCAEKLDYLPQGARVQKPVMPARTRLIAPAAVYAINPCTEEAARKAIDASSTREIILLEMPKERQIAEKNPPPDRRFQCCDGNPEDGHSESCLSDEEEYLESTEPA